MLDTTERRLLEDVKIDVLARGIRISPEAADWLVAMNDGPLSLHEYPTTGGLTLELPHRVLLNAPFDEWYCTDSVTELDIDGGDAFLRHPAGDVPIRRLLPLPGYVGVQDDAGRDVTEVTMSHADRIRVSPLQGCAYDCTFCDLPFDHYVLRDGDQLTAALAIAANDWVLPARHLLISGGSPKRRDYDRFEEVCGQTTDAALALGLPVDIMLSPTLDGHGLLDRLVERGVTGFSINIELFSDEAALHYLGRKYRVTRRVASDFITHAVGLLGTQGRVRSLIIPGLESVTETLNGAQWLADLGCWPVLSPFRPAEGTAASRVPPPSPQDLRSILDQSRDIVTAAGVALGPPCVPCQHNTLTFPWDIPSALREG